MTIKSGTFARLSQMALNVLSQYRRQLPQIIRQMFRGNVADYYEFMGADVVNFRDHDFSDLQKPLWLNLGYWREARNYPQACAAMATILGQAARFERGDHILDVGFGFAEQDFLWIQQRHVSRIVGVDLTPRHVDVAKQRVQNRGLEGQIELHLASATELPFGEDSFDKVVALECAFHFRTREMFFREAFRVLRAGGRIAATDMLPLPGESSRLNVWGVLERRFNAVNPDNMYDREIYASRLRDVGFVDVSVVSIRNDVYPGMSKYIRQRKEGRSIDEATIVLTPDEVANCEGDETWRSVGLGDYVLVSATKPGEDQSGHG